MQSYTLPAVARDGKLSLLENPALKPCTKTIAPLFKAVGGAGWSPATAITDALKVLEGDKLESFSY